jgi:hypothetical protein
MIGGLAALRTRGVAVSTPYEATPKGTRTLKAAYWHLGSTRILYHLMKMNTLPNGMPQSNRT